MHDGIKYPRKHCSYEATTKGHLEKHQKTVHQTCKSFLAQDKLEIKVEVGVQVEVSHDCPSGMVGGGLWRD